MKYFKAEHWVTLIIFCLLVTFAIFKNLGFFQMPDNKYSVKLNEEEVSKTVNTMYLSQINELFIGLSKTLSRSIVHIYLDSEAPNSVDFVGDDLRKNGISSLIKEVKLTVESSTQSLGQVSSLGSGFLVNSSGIIFTSAEVVKSVRKTKDQVLVRFSSMGKQGIPVDILGVDAYTNIAVLKIKSVSLIPEPVYLGDSSTLRVGEWVLAIGNPYGDSYNVSPGIVSSWQQTMRYFSGFSNFIVSSAYIIRGNSGGALFNLKGEVVGINTSNNFVGLGSGIAIPINRALPVVKELIEKGVVERGAL